MPAYGLAANSTFLSQNVEFTKSFMEEFEKSVSWVINNPEDAGKLAKKHLNADDVLIEKAMPNFNFNYVPSDTAQKDIEKYYDILFACRPKSIGGKKPDERFYYKTQ
ncbi:hypothetical protein ACS3UN_09015 [Oscillospiraceae bacterium LTW-04]|nr:hypothetical protein RBH76_10775 [Oscillospiraceae bacterium MB24-C1]